MTYSDAEIERLAAFMETQGRFPITDDNDFARTAIALRQLLSEVRAFRAESASHTCEHLSTKKAGALWWLCEDCGRYIERHFTRPSQNGDTA